MKALVTGATGFIGSHLAAELVKQGFKVTCLAREGSSMRWIEGLGLEVARGDCRDPKSIEKAALGADYVFHLAAVTKTARESVFYEVNEKGTRNVLEAASRNTGLKKFVLLSSLSAGGPATGGLPVNEETEPRPVSHYGKSKLMAEEAALGWARETGLPLAIIRPPAVYGPRDTDFLVFFKAIKKGFYPRWGLSRYSIIYVGDLVRGIIAAALCPARNRTWYLADPGPCTNDQIAHIVAEALSVRPLRVPLPRMALTLAGGISGLMGKNSYIINRDKLREIKYGDWLCDPSRAASELGFAVKTGLREGIKWTADWYRINDWL